MKVRGRTTPTQRRMLRAERDRLADRVEEMTHTLRRLDQLITAADMFVANPYLRDRCATGLAGHFRTQGRLAVDRYFLVTDALAV